LVARDAGLGEIGRMTLLMTPKEGPRVRLGVVTTDLELIPTPRKPNPSVIDFCNICQKYTENCPSCSIPFDDRQEIDGCLRWKLDRGNLFPLLERRWHRLWALHGGLSLCSPQQPSPQSGPLGDRPFGGFPPPGAVDGRSVLRQETNGTSGTRLGSISPGW
jgi:hypothetical protein